MSALLPRPSILTIEPYVGGESKIPGVNRIIKLSSNEGAFGVPPGAQAAYAKLAAELHRYPDGGSTALRVARERPPVPILVLTPSVVTARRLGLLWGTHAVFTRDVESFEEMVAKARRMALRHNIARAGDRVIVLAGVPFKTPGSTNVLHVVRLTGDELKDYG